MLKQKDNPTLFSALQDLRNATHQMNNIRQQEANQVMYSSVGCWLDLSDVLGCHTLEKLYSYLSAILNLEDYPSDNPSITDGEYLEKLLSCSTLISEMPIKSPKLKIILCEIEIYIDRYSNIELRFANIRSYLIMVLQQLENIISSVTDNATKQGFEAKLSLVDLFEKTKK